MTDRLIDLLGRLSGRERALLGVLVGVIAPLALWFGLLAPLAQDRVTALSSLNEARALEAWVNDRAAENALLRATAPQKSPPAIGASGVEQTLISSGLRESLSGLSDPGDGTLALRFDEVAFDALILWLSNSEAVWGYELNSFRLERTDVSGVVSAELALHPRN
ncbi:type II secretory pathway component PulM [Shimia isoporae]|uniref:Type II secretory pathway component PulM n=1 Tax=Shimia isoporae TaxID=647720 RepID=A0A4R1N1E2_9RHOB|nr:type II secretion system protein GspM [Shimia isoporae]TCK99857.1 type II secretory pathway component PulM [Shimia isoporae]